MLLLDEPLVALDLKLRQQMQHELRTIQGEVGITFIYVTHDQEEALTMSDRLAVFADGRIGGGWPPIWIFADYARPNQLSIVNVVGVLVILLSIIPVYFANRLSQDPVGAPGAAPGAPGAAAAARG